MMEKPDPEKKPPPQPPNLQALVGFHGSFSKVTPEAWKEFDRQVEEYRSWLRGGWRWTR
jgi:hypothetical protein